MCGSVQVKVPDKLILLLTQIVVNNKKSAGNGNVCGAHKSRSHTLE
jgi:hypothetical protein